MMQTFLGIFFGILISLAAWRLGSLSGSGAVAAALTGGLVFSLGGLGWAALLLTFFISSSVLSKAFKKRKIAANEKFAKGSRRDWGQVFANGGLGALLVIGFALWPDWPLFWFAYAGAMATVNADTWGTELGVLNPSRPRLLTTGQPVDAGTSGAISLYGMLATLGGAALIGLAGAAFSPAGARGTFILAATLGGVCGSLFDSLLGATIQAIYYCPQCDKETERHPSHLCGAATRPLRGWAWLNNDLVNFSAAVFGALVAILISG